MQNRLDVKTLILGVVLGGCLTASLGAVAVGGPAAGRFTMVTNEAHAYVLDTATGQVWERFAPTGSGFDSNNFHEPKIKPSKAPAPGK